MFGNEFAGSIALCAHKALLYEVLSSPKPGLVDRFNSGAHKDMDVFSFVDSASALLPYFYRCALVASRWEGEPADMLAVLRPEGVDAEKAMLKATAGVNTHKGAIFSMGLMCAAAGFCGAEASAEEICLMAGRIAQGAMADFAGADFGTKTAGERLYVKNGTTGVRGEAAAGFPAVRNVALPALKDALEKGMSLNDGAVYALGRLILSTEDTTFIKRCGDRDGSHYTGAVARALEGEALLEDMVAADKLWSENGLSAGGCADLLALALFLYFFEKEKM